MKGERIDINQFKRATSNVGDTVTNSVTSTIPKVIIIDPRTELEKMIGDAQQRCLPCVSKKTNTVLLLEKKEENLDIYKADEKKE